MEKPYLVVSTLAFILIMIVASLYSYSACAQKSVCDAGLRAGDTPVCSSILVLGFLPLIPALAILWLFYTPAGKATLARHHADYQKVLAKRWAIGMAAYIVLFAAFLIYMNSVLC